MSKVIEMSGRRFGLLTVIDRAESKSGKAYWNCVCDCGNVTVASGSNLRSGAVKSCGCLLKKEKDTHHLSGTRLYRIWRAMINRCTDENYWAYKYYGAKGVTICEQWENDFVEFKNWSESSGYCDSLTLDRIDNNKGYSPENCKWSTRKQQSNNRSFCKMIEYQGRTQTLMQWCEELGLNYKRTHSRLYRCGWTFEQAISTPMLQHGKK